MQTNKKQVELLMELRKDGRKQMTDISRKIKIPVSTICDRIKSARGTLVKRFTCLLDFSQLGFNCRTQIVLRVRKDHRKILREFLLKHQNINSVYKINNGYDFLVEAVFKELREVDEFMEKVDDKFKIHEKNVYYIIEDLARERFLTDPVHADMVGLREYRKP